MYLFPYSKVIQLVVFLGFKTGLIFYYYYFFFSLYLQQSHCPIGSNVDEWLHVDACTHCQNCVTTMLLLWGWVGV